MKIYLSSTYEDLVDHRRAVYEALRKAGHEVIAMESYVACDQRPVEKCLGDVAEADVYVGLFAFRYGYVPPASHGNPDGLSITELEYRAAETNSHTRCLAYVVADNTPWAQTHCDTWTRDNEWGEQIKRLRNELRTEKLSPTFTSPHQLAADVLAAVSKMEKASKPGRSRSDTTEPEPTWDIDTLGSPYPGLSHFTRKYAPVFFGRDADVQAVLERVASPSGSFVIISGDSGSGKSSLVDAGVLPPLETTGLPGERSCRAVYMVPSRGNDPFDALLRALQTYVEAAGLDPIEQARVLAAAPERLPTTLRTIVTEGLDRGGLVLFLDQMEELFTRTASQSDQLAAHAFLSALCQAVADETLWIIATIRSDFLHHCHRHPDLLEILRGRGHYPLGLVESYTVRDMITKPAGCAGLRITDAFVNRLIREAGAEPGSLPLLAFVLRRLFEERQDNALSETVYDEFGGRDTGGMKGALADYATDVEKQLHAQHGANTSERLSDLFEHLLVVNVEGIPTRRWTRAACFGDNLQPVVEVLVKKRLLTKVGEGEEATVSVAHEKLFEAWPALAHWIAEHEDALRTLSMAEVDAEQWRLHHYDIAYLWHPDRLQRLQDILANRPERKNDALQEYAWPQARLVELLDHIELSHEERLTVGRLLAQFGDNRPGVGLRADGVPAIEWVAIDGGHVVLEDDAGEQTVEPFAIACYPVTYAQFQAFVDARDGYQNAAWWAELKKEVPAAARWSEATAPRETVSWYEAVAFCRWLSAQFGYQVRLPTEFEWQQAATGGKVSRTYPWGDWAAGRCSSSESGLNRTTAVGLYPHGTWPGGPLDMAGNVWEWCVNKYETPAECAIDTSGDTRVLRGGSWVTGSGRCRAAYRNGYPRPVDRDDRYGFRLLRPPSTDR